MNRPTVVTLCGSTRFMDQFFASGWDETLKGRIVLSVGVAKHMDTPDGGHVGEALGPETCAALDELHKRKIDLSDEILVLNVDGYVGHSTRGEIEYAIKTRKIVRWLEPTKIPEEWACMAYPPPWKGMGDGLPVGRDDAGTAPDAGADRRRAGEETCPDCKGYGTETCPCGEGTKDCRSCGGEGKVESEPTERVGQDKGGA